MRKKRRNQIERENKCYDYNSSFCRNLRFKMISKKKYTNFFNVGFSLSYLLSYALRCEILAETKSECVSVKLFKVFS